MCQTFVFFSSLSTSPYWPSWPNQSYRPHRPHRSTSTIHLIELLTSLTSPADLANSPTHWSTDPLTSPTHFTDITDPLYWPHWPGDPGTQGPGTQTDAQLTLNWPPTDPYWTQTDPAQPVRPTLKLHWPYCSLRLWLQLQPQPWPSGQTLSRPVDLLPTSTNLCLSQPTWICTNHCPSLLRNSKFSDLQFLDLDYSL